MKASAMDVPAAKAQLQYGLGDPVAIIYLYANDVFVKAGDKDRDRAETARQLLNCAADELSGAAAEATTGKNNKPEQRQETIMENNPRVIAGAKAWDKSMGGRYAPNEVEELSEEVKVILAAADAVDPVRSSEAIPGLLLPSEFTWPEPPANQPDVLIRLPYAAAWDVFIDGLVNDASMHPLTPESFGRLAQDLLGLLTDASADLAEAEGSLE